MADGPSIGAIMLSYGAHLHAPVCGLSRTTEKQTSACVDSKDYHFVQDSSFYIKFCYDKLIVIELSTIYLDFNHLSVRPFGFYVLSFLPTSESDTDQNLRYLSKITVFIRDKHHGHIYDP